LGQPPSSATRARSTLFALVAMALDKGGGVLVLLLLARLLAPEDFGRYAALMSLLAFLQIAAEFGQEPVLVRLLAQQRAAGRVDDLVRGAISMRLWLAVAAGLVLVAAGRLVMPSLGVGALALAAGGLVASAGMALRALFRAVQRIEALCVIALMRVGTFTVALIAGHLLGYGFLAAIGGWALGQLAASLTAAALARSRVAPGPRWSGEVAGRLARSGWALAANAFLLTTTLRVGHLIVLRLEGPAAVGHLAAGAQLAEAFALLPEAVMLTLLPVLSAYEIDRPAAQRALGAQAVRWFVLLALPVIIVVSVLAPTLLGVLYGPAYVEGAAALRILAWLALLAATGTVFTNLLIARGLERSLLAVNAIGSGLTLGLSLVAVPRFGFVGAAAATLVASVVSQAVLLALAPMRADVAACLRPLPGPIALAIVLVLGGIVLGGSSVTAAGVAVAIFAIVLVATGAVGAPDWALIRRAAGLGGARDPG